ncbi:MAG: carbon-nitrogen hydrolase family protein [Gemmatimonadota bacterium]
MPGHQLSVALITDVFHDDPEGERLQAGLAEARRRGAELAVLPELPLNEWCPALPGPRDEDAEEPDGPRQSRMAAAARAAGIALLGGAIVRSIHSGRRHNTALLFDAEGEPVARHVKLHLPDEEGFWETRHYEPGEAPPAVIDQLGLRLGIQTCSDIQRPQGTALLATSGAEAVLVPRCTPAASWGRWRLVMRAAALTCALYIVSVNRPAPEHGVAIGGPSVVIGPDGEVLLETTDPIALATLDRRAVREARQAYPGYLPMRTDLYAHGWARIAAALGAIQEGGA